MYALKHSMIMLGGHSLDRVSYRGRGLLGIPPPSQKFGKYDVIIIYLCQLVNLVFIVWISRLGLCLISCEPSKFLFAGKMLWFLTNVIH